MHRTEVTLTNLRRVARYNALRSKLLAATHYFNGNLLASLGLLDDIRWLFARGGMGQFLETRDHTYHDLTLEFLSTLYVQVTRGP